MSNMSYCRFRNTLADLRDCESDFGDDDISEEEKAARVELIQLARRIVEDWEEFYDPQD